MHPSLSNGTDSYVIGYNVGVSMFKPLLWSYAFQRVYLTHLKEAVQKGCVGLHVGKGRQVLEWGGGGFSGGESERGISFC